MDLLTSLNDQLQKINDQLSSQEQTITTLQQTIDQLQKDLSSKEEVIADLQEQLTISRQNEELLDQQLVDYKQREPEGLAIFQSVIGKWFSDYIDQLASQLAKALLSKDSDKQSFLIGELQRLGLVQLVTIIKDSLTITPIKEDKKSPRKGKKKR